MNIPVRIELLGAAIAVASGVLLGGLMHPNLDGDERPAGPQIIAGSGGLRGADSGISGATLASYGGRIPDYVLGTDARKATTWPVERAATSAPAERIEAYETAQDELPTISRAAYDELRTAHAHDYPSLGGAPRDDADDAPAPTAGD